MGISDHFGKPKPFSSDSLVTENQKSIAKCCNFPNFLREIKEQVFTIDICILAFTLSPLNGISSRVFSNHIIK